MSKILKSISSKLKKASKAHASQANKIDKVLKAAPFKMKGFSGFGNSTAKLTKKQMDKPVKPKPGDYKKYSDLEKYDDDKQTGTKVDKKRFYSIGETEHKKALKKFDKMLEPKKKKEVTIGNVTYTISDKKQSTMKLRQFPKGSKGHQKRKEKVGKFIETGVKKSINLVNKIRKSPTSAATGFSGFKKIKNKKSPVKGKISASCKAYAKRRFKVWPSAYASGFAVKSQKAGKC